MITISNYPLVQFQQRDDEYLSLNQPRQLPNDKLHHRVRAPLDLQPLRQGQRFDRRVDRARGRHHGRALRGTPHRGCELRSQPSFVRVAGLDGWMVWRREGKGKEREGTHDDVRLVLLEQGGSCFGACARGLGSAMVPTMGEGFGGWVGGWKTHSRRSRRAGSCTAL